MIDSFRYFLSLAQKTRIGDELGLAQGTAWRRFGVLTIHRPSIVDSIEKLKELLSAIHSIAKELPIVIPAHPRTQQRLVQAGISNHPCQHLIQPLGYLNFLHLLTRATLPLTHSGDIREETTALAVPRQRLGENTRATLAALP